MYRKKKRLCEKFQKHLRVYVDVINTNFGSHRCYFPLIIRNWCLIWVPKQSNRKRRRYRFWYSSTKSAIGHSESWTNYVARSYQSRSLLSLIRASRVHGTRVTLPKLKWRQIKENSVKWDGNQVLPRQTCGYYCGRQYTEQLPIQRRYWPTA